MEGEEGSVAAASVHFSTAGPSATADVSVSATTCPQALLTSAVLLVRARGRRASQKLAACSFRLSWSLDSLPPSQPPRSSAIVRLLPRRRWWSWWWSWPWRCSS